MIFSISGISLFFLVRPPNGQFFLADPPKGGYNDRK
jgi:hypothetical protein